MSLLGTAGRELRALWNPVDFGIVTAASDSRAGWGSWAGVTVTEMRALQQTTVWACVSLISDSIVIMPADAYVKVSGFPRPVEPRPRLLVEPYAGLDFGDWLGALAASVLLRGNGYGQIVERDGLGLPAQIMPLHPDTVRPRRIEGRLVYEVGGVGEVDRMNIVHVRGLSLAGSDAGLDPISYARQTIGAALGAEEFAASWFGDGAQPSGVLATDAKLTPDDAKRYQDLWVEAHGNRHRRPAVLGGGLKWEPISLKPEEAQFLETIKAKRSEIAGWYRVPPHMVGDVERSTSWGTGIEEQMLGYVTFTLGIWINRFERMLTRLLPKRQYAKLNVAALLRGRVLDQAQAFRTAREGGWMNVDEIREKLELPPVPQGKGQDYLQPLNYGVVPPGGGPAPAPARREEEGA